MAHLLVVEDEKAISDLITMNLKLIGHSFRKAFNGKDALEFLNNERFDLILLDIMLPELDGFQIMQQKRDLPAPVILITAKDSLTDRIKGFELGADDYIIKPFETLELLARINVVLRRNDNGNASFVLGDVEVRIEERQVFRHNELVEMTTREFELLEVLIQNRNIALSREKLLEKAWGYDYQGESRTVDVHILKLRKKLGWEDKIKTVYKMGYRLEVLP